MSGRWQWNQALVGYAYHDGAGTAWIQLEATRRASGAPVSVPGAKDAESFDVAIIVGTMPVERFRLRGPLDRLQARLPAVLARRVERYRHRPAPSALPRWGGPGCWCVLCAVGKSEVAAGG